MENDMAKNDESAQRFGEAWLRHGPRMAAVLFDALEEAGEIQFDIRWRDDWNGLPTEPGSLQVPGAVERCRRRHVPVGSGEARRHRARLLRGSQRSGLFRAGRSLLHPVLGEDLLIPRSWMRVQPVERSIGETICK